MSPVSIKDLAGAKSLWEFYTIPSFDNPQLVKALAPERVLGLIGDPRARRLEIVEERENKYAVVRVEGLSQDGLAVFYYRFRARDLDDDQKARLVRHAQRFHATTTTTGRQKLARLCNGVGMSTTTGGVKSAGK